MDVSLLGTASSARIASSDSYLMHLSHSLVCPSVLSFRVGSAAGASQRPLERLVKSSQGHKRAPKTLPN